MYSATYQAKPNEMQYVRINGELCMVEQVKGDKVKVSYIDFDSGKTKFKTVTLALIREQNK